LRRECAEKNLELRVYHPLPHGLNWFRRIFWLYFRTLKTWQLIRILNHRNHRKITIIDRKRAYLGSLNYTQVHSEKIMGELAWRDTGVALEGSGVAVLEKAFYLTWRRAKYRGLMRLLRYRRRRTRSVRHPLVRLNSTQRLRFSLYRDLRRRIVRARSEVLVTTAYFVPKRSLLRALKKAAENGVRVELILPGLTDVAVTRWAALEVAQLLMKSGVKIYEYQHRILHAKYMVIDEYCSVGSLNLNHRSFLHDLEVEAVLNAPGDVAKMKAQWEVDRENSVELTAEKLRAISWPLRLLSRIAFRLRYLL
jgi:cardiolipin synthase